MGATVQQLAKQAAQSFEDAKREDGSEYLRITDGSPAWIKDMIREAGHDGGEILPDDWRYEFTYRACTIIEEAPEDEDEAQEHADQQLDTSVNVYTSDLTRWLASGVQRLWYLDRAIEDRSDDKADSAQLLMRAQYAERREVYEAVLQWLTVKAEE